MKVHTYIFPISAKNSLFIYSISLQVPDEISVFLNHKPQEHDMLAETDFFDESYSVSYYVQSHSPFISFFPSDKCEKFQILSL